LYSEIVAPILASLGGASLIVAAFAHFLGKIWIDRITKSTSARFNSELETLKSGNKLALEEFQAISSLALKDRENFAGISEEFYQEFFKKRVETYQCLLNIKNEYISGMEEEFQTELHEDWGNIYHSKYTAIRKLIIKKQLYISNDLDKLFSELRVAASEYIKEADFVEVNSYNPIEPHAGNDQLNEVYDKFAKETSEKMNKVFKQITIDVSKLRSRIEID